MKKTVSVRLDEDLYNEIELRAGERRQSLSDWFVQLALDKITLPSLSAPLTKTGRPKLTPEERQYQKDKIKWQKKANYIFQWDSTYDPQDADVCEGSNKVFPGDRSPGDPFPRANCPICFTSIRGLWDEDGETEEKSLAKEVGGVRLRLHKNRKTERFGAVEIYGREIDGTEERRRGESFGENFDEG